MLECEKFMNDCKIPLYSVPNSVMLKNNQSALKESHFVFQAIKDLFEKGLVEKCIHVPIVVNPLHSGQWKETINFRYTCCKQTSMEAICQIRRYKTCPCVLTKAKLDD